MGFKEREVLITEVNKQLKARVIEETNDTKYNSPAMCVPKKDEDGDLLLIIEPLINTQ